jgi:hypothetical protein
MRNASQNRCTSVRRVASGPSNWAVTSEEPPDPWITEYA